MFDIQRNSDTNQYIFSEFFRKLQKISEKLKLLAKSRNANNELSFPPLAAWINS